MPCRLWRASHLSALEFSLPCLMWLAPPAFSTPILALLAIVFEFEPQMSALSAVAAPAGAGASGCRLLDVLHEHACICMPCAPCRERVLRGPSPACTT